MRPDNSPRIPMPYKNFTQVISYLPLPPKPVEEKMPMPREKQEPKGDVPKL